MVMLGFGQISGIGSRDTVDRFGPLILIFAFILSAALKLSILTVGAPFVTIDDNTAFEGGFLVWFGQAPPQRMYLESWIYGVSCLSTYIVKMLLSGNLHVLGLNLVADAYRDYYGQPDLYVQCYRSLTIFVDMVTAYLVYRVGRQVLGTCLCGWGPILACMFYLFSYNTFWCDVVARPDAFVAFFSILGLVFYYKSDFGAKLEWLLATAVAFGLAAGMKLHGAFFTIFLVCDLLRVHGLRKGCGKVFILGFVSFFFFCFAAGSLFADPLTYIKLRMANAKDDASPWIHWGDQFITIFRGTGWLIVPGVLGALWLTIKGRKHCNVPGQRVKSIVLQAICWLILFSSIRQMRAYWMLPVLPIFYLAAVYALSCLRMQKVAFSLAIVTLLVMGGQAFSQIRDFKSIDFDELRRWVRVHVADKPIYIMGYEALMLPKNTTCIRKNTMGLRRSLQTSVNEGLPFTLRHLKNWEERSQLVLFDMLEYDYEPGYEYYAFYENPLELYTGIIDLDEMSYLLIQEHFSVATQPGLAVYLQEEFTLVAELTGAGGGGTGLQYKVYKRL